MFFEYYTLGLNGDFIENADGGVDFEPMSLITHKFDEMNEIYAGLLKKTLNFVKERYPVSPGEYTLRKAVLVKLFKCGKLKLCMLKETPWEKILTAELLNEWMKEPGVKSIVDAISFIDGLDGKVDGKFGCCSIS